MTGPGPAQPAGGAEPEQEQRTQPQLAPEGRGCDPLGLEVEQVAPLVAGVADQRHPEADRRQEQRDQPGGGQREDDPARERLGGELRLQVGARGELERVEGTLAQRPLHPGPVAGRAPRSRARRAWRCRGRMRPAPSPAGSRRRRRTPGPRSWEAGKRLATATICAGSCASWKSSVIAPLAGAAAATFWLTSTGSGVPSVTWGRRTNTVCC